MIGFMSRGRGGICEGGGGRGMATVRDEREAGAEEEKREKMREVA